MNMNRISAYIESLKSLLKRRGLSCTPAIVLPWRDWFVTLGVAVALVAGGFFYAAVTYLGVSSKEEIPVLAESGRPVLDASRLDTALSRMRLKAEEHLELQTAPPALADPSR